MIIITSQVMSGRSTVFCSYVLKMLRLAEPVPFFSYSLPNLPETFGYLATLLAAVPSRLCQSHQRMPHPRSQRSWYRNPQEACWRTQDSPMYPRKGKKMISLEGYVEPRNLIFFLMCLDYLAVQLRIILNHRFTYFC